MKKLMILGGSRFAMPVIEAAHRLGCLAITCDYLPDNYAHRFSDAYCDASVIDGDAVLEAARDQRVDGIISFACDPGVVTAAYVADRLGLPSVGPLKSVQILQDKEHFRHFLSENGFNAPFARGYHAAEDALKEIDLFRWPVMVKPVDSAGSKGVQRLDSPEGLREAVAGALAHSRVGTFIMEEYIEPRGHASSAEAFFANGRLQCAYFDCQRFDPLSENPYVPSAHHWPSSLSEAHQATLVSEIQRLLTLLHMGDSIYNIEARVDAQGNACIMECSPRGGGNRLAECIELATGAPLVENAVRAALGMPLTDLSQRPMRDYWGEFILHSQTSGVFRGLQLNPRVADAVVRRDLWVDPESPVRSFHSAADAIGTLVLRFDSASGLEAVMDHPQDYIKIEVAPE